MFRGMPPELGRRSVRHERRLANDVAAPRGLLDPYLLLVLMERPQHAYGLTRAVQEAGFGVASPAPVYTTLRRMERKGLVRSFVETADIGPSRRLYEVTSQGRYAMDDCIIGLRQLQRNIESWLDHFQADAPPARLGRTNDGLN